MVHKYTVAGQTLTDYEIPYQPGSQEYYQFIASWTAKAKGETYQKSQRLLELEAKMAADKVATADSQKEQAWKDAHKATEQEYAAEYSKWLSGQAQWNADITDLARQRDKSGQAADGYKLYDASGLLIDPALAGTAGAYWKADDPYFTGKGKMGGAGNENPAASVDNSWNEADGIDVRTDEQKYYDRNLSGYQETADENGTYNWYATETGFDGKDPKKARTVNLDTLASRDTSPDQVDPGKGAGGGFQKDKYWDYNGAPSKSYFDNEIANRKNLSRFARTA